MKSNCRDLKAQGIFIAQKWHQTIKIKKD